MHENASSREFGRKQGSKSSGWVERKTAEPLYTSGHLSLEHLAAHWSSNSTKWILLWYIHFKNYFMMLLLVVSCCLCQTTNYSDEMNVWRYQSKTIIKVFLGLWKGSIHRHESTLCYITLAQFHNCACHEWGHTEVCFVFFFCCFFFLYLIKILLHCVWFVHTAMMNSWYTCYCNDTPEEGFITPKIIQTSVCTAKVAMFTVLCAPWVKVTFLTLPPVVLIK